MASLIPMFLAIPFAGIVGILLLPRNPRAWAGTNLLSSLGVLGLALFFLFLTYDSSVPNGPVLSVPDEIGRQVLSYASGGWPSPHGIILRLDTLSLIMLTLTGVVFTAASAYQLGREKEERDGGPEANRIYHLSFPILLFALSGLFLTGDFFNFYVFFELVATASFILVTSGAHHPLEAAWKYLIQSLLASAVLLAGVAFLYGVVGALNMADVAQKLDGQAVWIAPFFLMAFLVKGSIFPFHWWQPDAHAAATTPGSALLAGLLINVGVYGILRFWPILFGGSFREILLWIGGVSLVFGAMAAWKASDAKRLLGFSSTSQLGFVLLSIGWGTVESVAAAIFFLVGHGLAKALLFLATGMLSDPRGSTALNSLRGLGSKLVWVQVCYFLGILSLVGLPPCLGFLSKISVLSAGVSAGSWTWVFVAASGSLMTLAYGIRAFHALFWTPGRESQNGPGRISPHPYLYVIEDAPSFSQYTPSAPPALAYAAMFFLAFLVVTGSVWGGYLWEMVRDAARISGWDFAARREGVQF